TNNTTTTTRAASGYSTASNTNPTTRPSSNSDNPMLLNGSGDTFTAALVVALVEWAARAVTPEVPAPSIGDRPTSPASRYPAHPAATGRITVWPASQMSSRQGTLSTKNSTTYMTAATPRTGQEVSCSGMTFWVSRPNSPRTNTTASTVRPDAHPLAATGARTM